VRSDSEITGRYLESFIVDCWPVSTLAICIVFVPMFLLSGLARYLFVPPVEAVVFAMLASYLLSRTQAGFRNPRTDVGN